MNKTHEEIYKWLVDKNATNKHTIEYKDVLNYICYDGMDVEKMFTDLEYLLNQIIYVSKIMHGTQQVTDICISTDVQGMCVTAISEHVNGSMYTYKAYSHSIHISAIIVLIGIINHYEGETTSVYYG